MKEEAFFARCAKAENTQSEDGREHDGHEEIGQEDADHRNPAEFEEDQEAERDIDGAIETEKGVGGEFLQDSSAGETADQEAKKAQ